MDNPRPHAEAAGPPFQGPHRRPRPPAELPADFVPLRLVLQPTGNAIELTRPDLVVGRHSEADVRLPLPDVSRWHCRFAFAEGCWQVIDLNSLNGVYVNNEAVAQAPLRHGDLVRIGGFTFAVELAGTGRPAADDDTTGPVLRSLLIALPPPQEPRRRAS